MEVQLTEGDMLCALNHLLTSLLMFKTKAAIEQRIRSEKLSESIEKRTQKSRIYVTFFQ